jgi:hypothetical protein
MAGDETRLLKEGGADFITNFILTFATRTRILRMIPSVRTRIIRGVA